MDIHRLKEKLDAVAKTFDYRLEKVLFSVAEDICALLETQNLSRADLAQRMGVSSAYITKMLNGYPNLTIKSLLKLSDALSQQLTITFRPKVDLTQSASTFPLTSIQASEYARVETDHEVPVEATHDLPFAA